MPSAPTKPLATLRVSVAEGAGQSELCTVAVEEPLEIRIAGDTVAITMRTPGHDRELALGFLRAEGIIEGLADVGKIAHCGRLDEAGFGNVLEVSPGPGTALDPQLTLGKRGTLTNAACGVCGRNSIEDLIARCRPLADADTLPTERLVGAVEQLAARQPIFTQTGGVHAAAAFDAAGTLLAAREDVGRHNAVDKVVGALLLQHATARACILAVSGRISFEIVQKAAVAEIPIVAGISAPTSLAVELAERSRITLAGFVRGGSLVIYSHAQRLVEGA